MQLKRNDAAARLRGTPKKIYTIWPSDKDGNPGGRWGQSTRWLVLDVTAGVDRASIVHGPVPRAEALAKELELRGAQ